MAMSSLQQADIVFLASLHSFCGGTLPLTICRSDKNGNSGKPMVRHPSCSFFHWFPQILSHPDIMALIPGGSPTLGAASAAPFPSTQPLALGSQLQPNSKKLCNADNQHPQADMQQEWDWGFDQESFADLETNWHDSSLDTGVEMNDGLRALQHALQSAGTEQPMFPSFHYILTAPAQPPAPSQQSGLPSLSQPPHLPPLSQPLCLPPLSQPPRLPPLSQPPHLPMLSQNDNASAMHAFPVHKVSKAPHITDQLDLLWAGDLNTRAREEIESKRVADRRKEMEQAAKQHFVLYWFDADDTPVLMQWVVHCPYFLQYQLSDDPTLIASLGTDIQKIDIFEESFMRWILSALTHPFTLDSGCHVFIRCHSITDCNDFDDLFKSSKLLARPSHMCFNMKGKHDSLRKMKKQRQASATASSSDIEIIDDTQLTPKPSLGKRHWVLRTRMILTYGYSIRVISQGRFMALAYTRV
ncbi:hypothetical protein DFJ58DRAFT_733812 [Suillus subalutaceus]|uniref:uncharacterized protein n=1 Tax=Suillus subalutaceus TaxID=48586 RepID=UPI001B878388|nr:uncharacterized protein DFJ58DRAFT_733812 [Suillus subalutaceus]KAG1838438.1 hypothetical protein DFJ58DRAFT_733812 [Suillus subalutaceus]